MLLIHSLTSGSSISGRIAAMSFAGLPGDDVRVSPEQVVEADGRRPEIAASLRTAKIAEAILALRAEASGELFLRGLRHGLDLRAAGLGVKPSPAVILNSREIV